MSDTHPFSIRLKHFWTHFFYFVLGNILNQNGHLQIEQGENIKNKINFPPHV